MSEQIPADELEWLRAQVGRLLTECDRIEQHVRENVPHLPPDAGHMTVHVIRRFFAATPHR
jgi:hypothetical protein